MRTIIHVNQHNIRKNIKNSVSLPVISIRTYKGVVRCNEVEIDGPCKIFYRKDKSLSCGARVWIETKNKVRIIS